MTGGASECRVQNDGIVGLPDGSGAAFSVGGNGVFKRGRDNVFQLDDTLLPFLCVRRWVLSVVVCAHRLK